MSDGRWRIAGIPGRWLDEDSRVKCDRVRLSLCISMVCFPPGQRTELTGCSDGPKEDSVVLLQFFKTIVRDVFAGLLVCFRAPIVVFEVQSKGFARRAESFEHFHSCVNNFRANAICGNASDFVVFARHFSVSLKVLEMAKIPAEVFAFMFRCHGGVGRTCLVPSDLPFSQ